MPRFLLLCVVFFSQLTAADEQWFVGTLGGQPLVTLHQESHPLPDGSRQTVCEMLMVIRRSLPGHPESRMEMRETQTIQERADGVISSFRFDHDENGSVTTASGSVQQDAVTGVLSRLGRTTPFVLPIAAGVRLLGDRASQVALARTTSDP